MSVTKQTKKAVGRSSADLLKELCGDREEMWSGRDNIDHSKLIILQSLQVSKK